MELPIEIRKINIAELLDQYADFQSQIDLLTMDQKKLLDEVKIPDEIQAISDQADYNKGEVLRNYWENVHALENKKAEVLRNITVPPEIQEALNKVLEQREDVTREYNEELQKLEEARALKLATVDHDFMPKVQEVYRQVDQRKQEIALEFAGKVQAAQKNLKDLEARIRAETIKVKETVRGKMFRCEYTPGRDGGWDGKKLVNLAVKYREILDAKKPDGEPYTSIKANK
jgi:hypothetical protein